MTLCTNTKAAVVEAIDESMIEFFTMMLGSEISKADEHAENTDSLTVEKIVQEVTVVMGLAGGLTGSVCISMSDQAAFTIAKGLIDHDAVKIDQTVVDGVGEVANIVVGGAKRRLAEFQLSMSLPNVVLAGQEAVKFPTTVTPTVLNYDYENTQVSVLVGLCES